MTTRRDALVVLSAAIPSSAESKFLTANEFALTAKLVDLIIPRTDTPGASDAKVHVLIDERCASNTKFASDWRAMLGWLKNERDVERASKAGSSEFRLLKDTTIDLYYSTKAL
jgi:hypothetical protein